MPSDGSFSSIGFWTYSKPTSCSRPSQFSACSVGSWFSFGNNIYAHIHCSNSACSVSFGQNFFTVNDVEAHTCPLIKSDEASRSWNHCIFIFPTNYHIQAVHATITGNDVECFIPFASTYSTSVTDYGNTQSPSRISTPSKPFNLFRKNLGSNYYQYVNAFSTISNFTSSWYVTWNNLIVYLK